MKSNSKSPKTLKLQVLKVVEKLEEEQQDVFGGLVMDNLLGAKELKRTRESKVQIMMEDVREKEEEEDEEDQEKEKEHEEDKEEPTFERHVTLDDLPKEDFFDERDNGKEDKFGDIKGMAEVVEDEEDFEYYKASARAHRLSMHAQKFAEEVAELKRESTLKASDELARKQLEEEEQVRSEQETLRKEETVSEDTEDAISQQTTDFKSDEGAEEPPKMIDLSGIRLGSGQSQVSGYSMMRPMYYEYSARIDDSEADLLQFFDLDKQEKFILLDESEKEVEEEEFASVFEEEQELLDREPYFKKYDEIVQKISENKIRNNIFQKKVTMYLKRRKVENFLKDGETPLDQTYKYNQKLDAYQQILEIDRSERKIINEELDGLKRRRAEQSVKLEKLFRSVQTRESNIGYGLIHTKTGNSIPDKQVERLIRRQKTQSEQVSTMRLKYLKLKGMVQEKLDAINKIDQLENNLRLGDYEQLKVENRNYADKMEERDEELTRLRAKCQNTIQVLAHMREKSAALETDVRDLKDELVEAAFIAEHNRETLVDLKHKRDKYRYLSMKIRAESGLLIQPDLLRDMEASQVEIEKMKEELQACRDDVTLKTTQVRTLRKNIERRTEILNKKKEAKLKGKISSLMGFTARSNLNKASKSRRVLERENEPTIYPRRLTLLIPVIKSTAFHDLIKVKPNPKASTRRRR